MPRLSLTAGSEPVAGYRLLEPLGKGGFGEVWRAEAPGGLPVAMKFIPLDTGQAEPELRALETIRTIRHPNLLEVHFAAKVDDQLVLATSLCDQSLWDRLKEVRAAGKRGIPRAELLDYIDDTARALDYLNEPRHRAPDGTTVGIQHRDVKPHNILLVGGAVKLADFGLAKALQKDLASHTGSMTPAYAAPELFHGKIAPNSDQWSLAVTYVQLRTGQLPFPGDYHEIVYKVMHEPPDLTSLAVGERPVVARALSKAPGERWPNCRAFAAALRAADLESEVMETARAEPAPTALSPPPPTVTTVAAPVLAQAATKPVSMLNAPRPRAVPRTWRSLRHHDETVERSSHKKIWVGAGLAVGLAGGIVAAVWTGRSEPNRASIESAEAGKQTLVARATAKDNSAAARPEPNVDSPAPPPAERTPISPPAPPADAPPSDAPPVNAPPEPVVPVTEARVDPKQPDSTPTPTPPSAEGTEGAEGADATEEPDPPGIVNSIGMRLILIPAGKFQMGSSSASDPRNETPRHLVRLTRPFEMGVHEVTVGQFRAFAEATNYRTDAEKDAKGGWGYGPDGRLKQSGDFSWRAVGFPQGDDHPVVNVSWNDAALFCAWLSTKEGRTYRLPTEAEWEYACRAGTSSGYWGGDEPSGLARIANLSEEAFSKGDGVARTAAAGTFASNPFGLFDMHGNVWEWCQDAFGDNYYARSPPEDPTGPEEEANGPPRRRVRRGGSYCSGPDEARCAHRMGSMPDLHDHQTGFRVVRVVDP